MEYKVLDILLFLRKNALYKNKEYSVFLRLMESTRQKKVSRLLQKELSAIFQKETPKLLGNVMVSVTIVRVSADLANANIFISIFPVEKPKEALRVIKNNSIIIRKRLGESVRNQLRIVPLLEFFLDDSAAYYEEIDRLLKK
tara:strand:- start:5136 stop:5561 length:426 start_codon:yes stop_codon:yes gene_type:complete